MKYDYYWFIGNKRIAETYYQELLNREDVSFVYKDEAFDKSWLNKLFRLTFSQKMNSKMHMPFKKQLFKCLLNSYGITDSSQTVFIFHEGWFDIDISNFLKSKYPNIKTIIYFDDTIGTYAQSIPSLNPMELKEQYDYVLAYNPSDAEKYELIKCNACFSKLNIANNPNMKSDICFIGQPKDRYELLESIRDYLGKQCNINFIVVGDSEGNDEGITLTKKYISYEKYLQNEISSNCILEILKGDTQGATFRCWEAVYYNRKLLTNWKGITSFEYYDPRYMMYFEKPEDIDIDFIKSEVNVDYHYKGENSPSEFLRNIESIISRGE